MIHVKTYLLIHDQELHEFHTAWLKRKGEEQRAVVAVQEPEGETPIAFVPKDLPIRIDIGIPPPVFRGIESPSVLHHANTSSATPTNGQVTAESSPTLSISTISDLTPTESGDIVGEDDDEETTTRHKTFYLEDGNVEVLCGHTVFRIHSPVVSFSSPKLRDMFSPSTLLNAPMPEGCPRIVLKDSPEDFAVLLRMFYTPGYASPPLHVIIAN